MSMVIGSNDRVKMVKIQIATQSALDVIDAANVAKGVHEGELEGWEFSGAWVKERNPPPVGHFEFILIFLREE
jgi:hypothetical protein